MRYVTIVNRAPVEKTVTWEGKRHRFASGEEAHVDYMLALQAKNQHPIMGSDDDLGYLQSYFGIVEENDPIEPVTESKSVELFNRAKMKNAMPVVIVENPLSGLYARMRREDLGPDLADKGNIGFGDPRN